MDHSAGDARPLITTVIPTFRRPKMLKRAVVSALEQEGVPLQVCVYDNASGDETGVVVETLRAEDSRLRYHCHERNLGAFANFEYGMRAVSTPFFSILSDDDYLLPGFYKRALDDLARHPEAMFWAGLTLSVDESGKIYDARVARWPREGLFAPPEGLMRVMHGMALTWTGIVFRREVLAAVGLLDQETLGPSDLDYIMRITAQHSYLLYKVPSAVFVLNTESFSATQPLSSFWPGWQKMIRNLESLPGLDARSRKDALAALHKDAQRMLFRRGANALAQGRGDFARNAAHVLKDQYGLATRAAALRILSFLCERSMAAQRAYTAAYRLAERNIIKSRGSLQAHYGQFIRPA